MMSQAESHSPADADWRQLELFVEQLHASAHAQIEVGKFYRELLEGCVTLLAAEGGAVWLPAGHGQWRISIEVNRDRVWDGESASDQAAHLALLQQVAEGVGLQILQPRSRGVADGENPTAFVLALVAVDDGSAGDRALPAHAVIELFLRPGSSPDVQQGWRELLTTLAQVAGEFHVRDQLRSLRSDREFFDRSLALTRRFQESTNLKQTVFEVANEGRRFVAADRLSVLVRRGKNWQLLATSGVDRIEARADVVKRLQMLAAATADWAEPLDFVGGRPADLQECPPVLTQLVEQHVDESRARRLVAVPVEMNQADERPLQSNRAAAVLVAEQFTIESEEFSQQRVIELAQLCQPALRQAIQLDRFPVRGCLRWADRWAEISEKWGFTKLSIIAVAAIAVLLSLMFVKRDFEVEAPATLSPLVQRDVFATTNGKVVDVRIAHGEQVGVGDVLAVLDDPQLSLEAERVDGEIATIRKRLEAIAVARTDRQVREEAVGDELPLSAEAEQLERRLASLKVQQQILVRRREALTLCSPITGTVLTLDVQNLLQTRPVERGQVLFTVADTTAGWRLLADVPQDRIGQIVAAQKEDGTELPVRFRIAGDTKNTYRGHVESISTAAVLDTAGLEQESPAFEVVVSVDEGALPEARPGMAAAVRVYCGRRSLGYIWLHDAWETVYSWVVF